MQETDRSKGFTLHTPKAFSEIDKARGALVEAALSHVIAMLTGTRTMVKAMTAQDELSHRRAQGDLHFEEGVLDSKTQEKLDIAAVAFAETLRSFPLETVRLAAEAFAENKQIAAFAEVPRLEVPRTELTDGVTLVDLLARTIEKSKDEARRLIARGGAFINNIQVEPAHVDYLVTTEDMLNETVLVIGTKTEQWLILAI